MACGHIKQFLYWAAALEIRNAALQTASPVLVATRAAHCFQFGTTGSVLDSCPMLSPLWLSGFWSDSLGKFGSILLFDLGVVTLNIEQIVQKHTLLGNHLPPERAMKEDVVEEHLEHISDQPTLDLLQHKDHRSQHPRTIQISRGL